MSDLLDIQVENVEDVVRFSLEGNMDTNSSPDAQEAFMAAIDGGATKILVDLEALDFISSAGLRVLLTAAKAMSRHGGSMRICSLNETVDEVFEISGFNTILNVFASREEAMSGF